MRNLKRNMRKLFFGSAMALLVMANVPSIAAPRTDLFGDPIPPSSAARTITITPDTRFVNVEGGEWVRFMVGDRSFGWAFNVAISVSSFDLNQVAPPGILDHKVIAYVSPDPKYRNVN
jgi:hypothetical protein